MAQDQANSLVALSSDIYTVMERFLYELLQNADDASCDGGELELTIEIIENYLIFAHHGTPFTEVDVESICSVGDGNKKGDSGKTGFKGIGFKSVFSHSDFVFILSRGFSFSFSQKHWVDYWHPNWGDKDAWLREREAKGKEPDIKMPWQIIPKWQKLPGGLEHLKKYQVATVIRHNDMPTLRRKLGQLFEHTQVLLFLRSENVHIRLQYKDSVETMEKVRDGERVHLKKNGTILSSWSMRKFQFEVPAELRQKMEHDPHVPKKLRVATRAEMSFAIQVEQNSLIRPDKSNRIVFTYLPTSVNYNFPFLVNAGFLTDAGRQNLHDDVPWNKWLFGEMPKLFFTWLSELAETKVKGQIFGLIPSKLGNHSELGRAFNEGFLEALRSIAFIPNKSGQLLRAGEALLDATGLSEGLYADWVVQYVNQNQDIVFSEASLIPSYEPVSTLKRLGVHFFESNELQSFFQSDFLQDQITLAFAPRIIRFLYERSEHLLNREEKMKWDHFLESTPFLLDEDEVLRKPTELYLPTTKFAENASRDVRFMHPELFTSIREDQPLLFWLERLGVRELTDTSFIEDTLIGDPDYVTKDNAIEVGRYLFKLEKKGALSPYYDKLQRLKVLSTTGQLVSVSNAFLSSAFQPIFDLESIYEANFYVSPEYVREDLGELKSEWATLWIRLGVKNNLYWAYEKVENNGNPVIEKYHEQFREDYRIRRDVYINFGWQFNFCYFTLGRISFMEECYDNHSFARLFWKYVISDQKGVPPPPGQDLVEGYTGIYRDYWKRVPQTNYFKWSIDNIELFPTKLGDCRKASEVILNTPRNREIGGSFLPILDVDIQVPEVWLRSIPFRQHLGLEDYLAVLEKIAEGGKGEATSTYKHQIDLIYSDLAQKFLHHRERLSEWAAKNKILAKGGQFMVPKDLTIVLANGFRAKHLAYYQEEDKAVIDLFRIWGVRIVENLDLEIAGDPILIKTVKEYMLHLVLAP